MVQTGALVKFNSERGFGFLRPSDGGRDIFIHGSEFNRAGLPAQIGEEYEFVPELAQDGRTRARDVRRIGGELQAIHGDATVTLPRFVERPVKFGDEF